MLLAARQIFARLYAVSEEIEKPNTSSLDAPKDVASSNSGITQPSDVNVENLRLMGEMISSLVNPLARAQEVAATEETKRTQIEHQANSRIYLYVFILVGFIVGLAVLALVLGKDKIVETVITGVFGLLAGFGLGKAQNNKN